MNTGSGSLASQSVQKSAIMPHAVTGADELIRKREASDLNQLAAMVIQCPMPRHFRSVLPAIGLKNTQGKYNFSLFPFDFKKRDQRSEAAFRMFIGCLPAVKRAAVIAMWFLFIIPTTQSCGQKCDGWLIYHSNLYSCLIARSAPALAFVGFGFLNSDIPLAIDQSCEVGNVQVIHWWDYVTKERPSVKTNK